MDKSISLELNSVDLLKYALFKDYSLPEDIAVINLTQERILMTVKNSVNVSMVSISRAIGLEKSPFSQSVDKLESLGLLERIRSNTDRRQIHLQLTAQGLALSKKVEDSMETHFSERIKILDPNELNRLYDALSTIHTIANKLISQ